VEIGHALADTLSLPVAVVNYKLSTKEDPSLIYPVHVTSCGDVVKHVLEESELSHIQRLILLLMFNIGSLLLGTLLEHISLQPLWLIVLF
jgi:hypothetical protein